PIQNLGVGCCIGDSGYALSRALAINVTLHGESVVVAAREVHAEAALRRAPLVVVVAVHMKLGSAIEAHGIDPIMEVAGSGAIARVEKAAVDASPACAD